MRGGGGANIRKEESVIDYFSLEKTKLLHEYLIILDNYKRHSVIWCSCGYEKTSFQLERWYVCEGAARLRTKLSANVE